MIHNPKSPGTRYPAAAPVIGMASSAGGLNALIRILECLPLDFPAAILIVQHVGPASGSHLVEVLARRSQMPVRQATSGTLMEPGVVYVAPPGAHLLVHRGGRMSLSDLPPVHFVRPSGDRLFQSLALGFGSRAVAVVLTGMGRDGADGARAVKLHGGTVLVQDQSTSAYFGMPGAAIDAGLVEHVLPLNQIAPALVRLVGEEETS